MKAYTALWFSVVLIAGISFDSCSNQASKIDIDSRISSIDSSLHEVYGMLNRAGTTIKYPDVIMITFILREHFNINYEFPSIEAFIEKRPYLLDQYFKLYDTYFDGKFYVNSSDDEILSFMDENLDKKIDAMTFWSMYCEKFPLDDRFLKRMRTSIDNPPFYPNLKDPNIPPPEYWVMHAALQLQGAENGDCLESTKELDLIREDIKQGLLKLANEEIETKIYDQDIYAESLAMLFYTGNDALVTEDNIDRLLFHQLNGGGWSYSTGSESVSLHTSVLAMWVLLEYKESLQNS